MRMVLGVDAAWTVTQPSGVALVVDQGQGWRLVRAASSYGSFTSAADDAAEALRPIGSIPDATSLLSGCARLAGGMPDIVAIDMPMSRTPITERRAADNAVSVAYGARHCSTHTPSATRPGRISDDLTEGFAAAGYPLQTAGSTKRGLIEVYPHPALVELAGADRRLPYKATKIRSYWPELNPLDRRHRLIATWASIVTMLDREIAGVTEAMSLPDAIASGIALKAFEDKLDAIVCAWVGICVLRGRAVPYGDETASIWIPVPDHRHRSGMDWAHNSVLAGQEAVEQV